MILDGVIHGTYNGVIKIASNWKHISPSRQLVVVTSQQISLHDHERRSAGIETWCMPPWMLFQYQTACRNKDFYEQIKKYLLPSDCDDVSLTKDELILSKYYMAGTSARWMFGTLRNRLQNVIDQYLRQVGNTKLLTGIVQGDKSAGVVNHLKAVDERSNKMFFVSRYVMRRVLLTCEGDFLKQAEEFAQNYNNPAFYGWVFEFTVLMRVRKATGLTYGQGELQVLTQDTEKKLVRIPALSFREVEPKEESGMRQLPIGDGFWVFPKLWNQGDIPTPTPIRNPNPNCF